MERTFLPEFSCPQCGRPAERCNAVIARSLRLDTLSFPYFLCGECRLMYLNRRLVRRYVSDWRKTKPETMKIPFESIYLDVGQFLRKIELCLHEIGYRPARFISKTPQS